MIRCSRCQRRLPPGDECPTHGRPTTAIVAVVEPEATVRVLAPRGWTLGVPIAHGGTSLVYAIEREGTPPAVLKWGRWRDRDVRARFAMEAEVLRAAGPPATPQLFDEGSGDWPYLIMERVEGETLAAWMARTGERGGIGEILAVLVRIAAALVTVHEAGFVHRDLKPENACISGRGVRLLDFGLAKRLQSRDRSITQIGAVVGTVHYMAPEQIRTGGVVDQRADLYSFGVIAYEMLTGMPPFIGERRAIEYQHQVSKPPPLRDARDVPAELAQLVHACLAKQAESRPASAGAVVALLNRSLGALATLRGIGGASVPERKPLGTRAQVALAWVTGGDPVEVTRAAHAVTGIVAAQRGDAILLAFTALDHDAPVAIALAACRELAHGRCRIALHLTTALVRRPHHGRVMVYGDEVGVVDTWIPAPPFTGIVLTSAAAAHAGDVIADAELPGWFRERDHRRTDITDVATTPPLVGRANIVAAIVENATGTSFACISGEPGSGKSRLLETIADRLRESGREVVAIRVRRRFLGEQPDSDRRSLGLLEALEPGTVIAIDDADRLPQRVRRVLARARGVRIATSREPLFEVTGDDPARLAITLPPLEFHDAQRLVREQLQPARLIPDVLVERIALRGAGNAALLLALARDLVRRGAVRRHVGSDEWYVAADELDTLLAPPGPGWLAGRALEDLPAELAPMLRACAGLGPRFCAGEVATVTEVADAERRLAWLVKERVLDERDGWYEFGDPQLQAAIYDHQLDQRERVHARALRYWTSRGVPEELGGLARVAYHAERAGDARTAANAAMVLARAALRCGNAEEADELLARALATA